MDEFYKEVAEILEVDDVKGSDELQSYSAWDSLSILSLIAMVSSRYGVNLTARDVRTAVSVDALHDLVLTKRGG